MDVLIRYGFSIEEIKNMMDSNTSIESIDDRDIYELIDLLGSVGCMNNHIRNIFISNPFYLSRNTNDIKELIKKLYDLNFNNLYVLFDINPFILNLDCNEIEEIYNTKKSEGLSDDEIVDYFNLNIII